MIAGRDLCFTMSVTDERALVRDRVARLQRVHPGCRVVLLAEGSTDGWPTGDGIVVEHAGRLYPAGLGGAVVERHLEAFLDSGARWWFKVDPDTVAWRALASLPRERCFFGTVQGGKPLPSLQGGCVGGVRKAASALLRSGALRADALREPGRSWAEGNPNLLARAEAGFVSFDFVHAWACREAGIPLVGHAEIRSEWRDPPERPWRYAVTHPHKTLDLAAEIRAAVGRRRVAQRLAELLERELPPSATVAVVSKGDPALVVRARHFPADERGEWAGFHPQDSDEALALLARAQEDGVDHFALPETGEWWLEHYTGLALHLATHGRLVVHAPGAGRVWALERRA